MQKNKQCEVGSIAEESRLVKNWLKPIFKTVKNEEPKTQRLSKLLDGTENSV